MKKNAVIFHSLDATTHCDDGFGSYWAAYQKLGDAADYFPAIYSQPVPLKAYYDTVYFVDFCYDRELMKDIAAKFAGEIIVLDHHKTAIENMEGIEDEVDNIKCHFDLNRSGAVITWEYFHGHGNVPQGLLYIQDNDLWRFDLKETKEFIRGMRARPQSLSVWDDMMQDVNTIMRVIEDGRVLQDAFEAQVKKHVGNSFWAVVGGHRVPVSNCSPEYCSDVACALLEEYPEAPFAVSFHVNGTKVKMSLRSDRDGHNFDVATLAGVWGGGGHRNAAGCSCTLENLNSMVLIGDMIE